MAEVRRRRREYWAGLGAVLAAVVVLASGSWPVPDAVRGDHIVDTLLGDRVLVGILRLAVVVVALYAIASVPALVAGGRWVKGLGTSGILADDARIESGASTLEADRRLYALQKRNDELEGIVDDLWALVEIETAPE